MSDGTPNGRNMKRERLPSRRPQVTDDTRWPGDGGRRIHVSAGLAADGRILEAFLRGSKSGSELDFLLDDIAVLLSRDLQHGDRLAQIASGLGRLPDGKPASLIGAVVDRLRSIEAGEP
jgi:hypothetical protein